MADRWRILRDQLIQKDRADGAKLSELADKYNLTESAVSQICNKGSVRNPYVPDGSEPLHWRTFRIRAESAKPCIICGYWVLRPGLTCSADCARIYDLVDDLFNPDIYERRRRANARYIKKHLPEWREWAERVEQGKGGPPKFRYFKPGSRRRRIALLLGLTPRLDRSKYLFP